MYCTVQYHTWKIHTKTILWFWFIQKQQIYCVAIDNRIEENIYNNYNNRSAMCVQIILVYTVIEVAKYQKMERPGQMKMYNNNNALSLINKKKCTTKKKKKIVSVLFYSCITLWAVKGQYTLQKRRKFATKRAWTFTLLEISQHQSKLIQSISKRILPFAMFENWGMLSGLTEATDVLFFVSGTQRRKKPKRLLCEWKEEIKEIKCLGKNTIKLNIIQI